MTQRSTQALNALDRDLRHQIRSLQHSVQSNKDSLTRIGSTGLQELLVQAEELQSQVTRPREQALESELFHNLSEYGLEMAKKLVNGTQVVQPRDFVLRCANLFAPGEDSVVSWQRMAMQHWARIPTVAGVGCMLGPLGTCPKPGKVPSVRQRGSRNAAPAVHPQELLELNEEDRQDTDRHIEDLWRTVNHIDRSGQSVHIIPLILCHDSFSQTVENLFALSFLVRDGRVRFTKTPAGLRVVPVTKHERSGATAHLERRQAIMTVSMSDWVHMKRAVPKSQCLLPTREDGQQAAAVPGKAAARTKGPTPAGVVQKTSKCEEDASAPNSKGKRRRTVLGSTENTMQESTPRQRGRAL